jgi:replicative DNA helicase
MPGVVKEIIELANNPDKLTGIPAGFMGIDRTTGGWQKSDLIIIAGRPGMGKTTFALQLALNAAKYNHNVAYFSLEMSTTQNIKKIISNQTEIELTRLNIGKITLQEQKQLAHNCNNKQLNIYIDDTAALTTTELRTKAYKLKQKHNIELIIVDYLQLMTIPNMSKYENREAEIRKISQSLKQLAKELNIPLIVLSQLSREVEKRGGNFRPKLSDLRESGSIENDADIVIFPFRAEYYKQEVIECGEQQYAAAGACLIDIAKGRNIGTSELLLNYSGRFSKFSEYSATFQPDQNLFEITTSAEANPFE